MPTLGYGITREPCHICTLPLLMSAQPRALFRAGFTFRFFMFFNTFGHPYTFGVPFIYCILSFPFISFHPLLPQPLTILVS